MFVNKYTIFVNKQISYWGCLENVINPALYCMAKKGPNYGLIVSKQIAFGYSFTGLIDHVSHFQSIPHEISPY